MATTMIVGRMGFTSAPCVRLSERANRFCGVTGVSRNPVYPQVLIRRETSDLEERLDIRVSSTKCPVGLGTVSFITG